MPQKQSNISRRNFLAKTARSAAGLAAAGTLASCATRPEAPDAYFDPPPATTQFGFTTYTWGKDWDIPTLIANLNKAQVRGLEMRTSQKYAHGVELDISPTRRLEVKKQFADSPVTLLGLASSERFDSTDPAKVRAAIEAAKAHIKLSHDIGGSGVRVFPNDFHDGTPREKTIAQIARAVSEVGVYAADYGQQVRLECHGSAGDLQSIAAIMKQVTSKSVRIKLNSDSRDTEGKGFEANFNLVRPYLGDTLHLHNMKNSDFPYQTQMNLLVKSGWRGWQLLEASDKVPDRLAALIEQREIWERLRANALMT